MENENEVLQCAISVSSVFRLVVATDKHHPTCRIACPSSNTKLDMEILKYRPAQSSTCLLEQLVITKHKETTVPQH